MTPLNSLPIKQLESSPSEQQSNLKSIASFETLSSLNSLQQFQLSPETSSNNESIQTQMEVAKILQQYQHLPQQQTSPNCFEKELLAQQITILLKAREQHEQQQAQQRAMFDQQLLQLQAQHFIRAYQQEQQQQQQQLEQQRQQQFIIQQNLLFFQQQQQQQNQQQFPTSASKNLNINSLGGSTISGNIIPTSFIGGNNNNNNNNNNSLADMLLLQAQKFDVNAFFQGILNASNISNNLSMMPAAIDENQQKKVGFSQPQSNSKQLLCSKRKTTENNKLAPKLSKKIKTELPKKTSISLEAEDSETTLKPKSSENHATQSSPKTSSINSSIQADKDSLDDDKGNTSKDARSRSKFHNLTKLFLNSLLSIFTKENMDQANIFSADQDSVVKCISRVKQSGRKTQGKVCKTDLFNHSHYNVLFLKLTPESIIELASKPKDASIHQLCFDIDVTSQLSQEQIDSVNKIKQNIFIITHSVLANPADQDSVRHEYWLRAIVGIRQLAEGKLIYRFQSLNKHQQISTNTQQSNSKVEYNSKPSNNSSLLSINESPSISTIPLNHTLNVLQTN